MSLKLEIITPNGIVWKESGIDSVVLPARNGETIPEIDSNWKNEEKDPEYNVMWNKTKEYSTNEIEILSGHIPLITMLNAGYIVVKNKGKEEKLVVSVGYARCMGDVISVLTEDAIEISEINEKDAEAAIAEALKLKEEAEKNKLSDEEINRLETVIRFNAAQLLVKNRIK